MPQFHNRVPPRPMTSYHILLVSYTCQAVKIKLANKTLCKIKKTFNTSQIYIMQNQL